MSNKMSKLLTNTMSESRSDKILECLPGRMLEYMSDNMTKSILNWISEFNYVK